MEKPLAFAPRGRVALTPSGEIVLPLFRRNKMTPEKQTCFRGFFVVLRYLPWPVVNNPKLLKSMAKLKNLLRCYAMGMGIKRFIR